MRKFLIFSSLFFLAITGVGCHPRPRPYGYGVYNHSYDAAWRREQRRICQESAREWERAEQHRAMEDARRGVYQPW